MGHIRLPSAVFVRVMLSHSHNCGLVFLWTGTLHILFLQCVFRNMCGSGVVCGEYVCAPVVELGCKFRMLSTL